MVENANLKVICCTDTSDCCKPAQGDTAPRRKIEIEFLYLDLSICTRCQGADNSLDDAIAEVSQILKATDVDVVVSKINVTDEKQAEALQFESSPTIRVNGKDIQLEIRESHRVPFTGISYEEGRCCIPACASGESVESPVRPPQRTFCPCSLL